MANLSESSTFDAGVYQLELTDPVIGGASGISNAPLKNLANRTKYLKDHVDALETSRAPIDSPAFTGNPTAPTPTASDNDTSIATTAFVKTAVAAAVPDLSGYAPKASPTFTGNPVAPTPAQFDNDTSLATTAFVMQALGNFGQAGTGIVASKVLTAADAGKVFGLEAVGINVTLPLASTVPSGTSFLIYKRNASIATASIIHNGVTVRSVSPREYIAILFISNGVDGYVQVDMSTGGAPESQTQNGYHKFPSGLLMQWGMWDGGAAYSGTNSYPISFPNTILIHLFGTSSNGTAPYGGAASNSTYNWYRNSGTSNNGFWIAFGY